MTKKTTAGSTTPSSPRSDVGLTVGAVARKAIELAEANPEFIYQQVEVEDPTFGPIEDCAYIHDGSGSCLFGQALVALGVDPWILSRHEGQSIDYVLRGLGAIRSDEDERLALTALEAQGLQDAKAPWGEAVGPLRTHLEAGQ